MLRLNPSEKGLLPYGAEEAAGKKANNALASARNSTLLEAIKERNFWLLFMINAFHIMIVQIIMVHLKTHITDVGIPAMAAATILGVVGGASVLGRIAIGGVSAIFGFGYGGCVPLPAAIIGDWFGTESHGRILGVLSLAGMLGGVGPIVAGYIFDVTGSYDLSFIIGATALFIAMGLSLVIKIPRTNKVI